MGGKRISLIALALVLAAFGVGSAQAGDKPNKPDKPEKGDKREKQTILVQFVQPGYDNDALVQQDGDEASGAVGELKTRTVIVKLKKDADLQEKIAEYLAREDVVYAEENGIASATDDTVTSQAGMSGADPVATAASVGAPDDPYYGTQYGHSRIHTLDAWSFLFNGYNVPDGPSIAIVDSGVDSLHPDLWGRVATDLGANCLTGVCVSDGAADDFGHGTHVAGIAAARANDGIGVAGVAFNSQIIPVKVLDSAGNGSYASIASGIIWAADQGARVINVSLGSTAYSQTVCNAVGYAIGLGSVVVAAAGNLGTSTAFYPAACSGTIGVAATDSTDIRASFSETSYPNVFASAPGVGIVSDYPNDSYRTDSGTSMSAPFVAGVASLLLAQNPSRTVLDVKRQLAGTADKVGTVAYAADPYATCACTWNASYGYGRVNAHRALTDAPPAPAPDYSISTSLGTVTVQRSKSSAATVSSSSLNGFASTIGLSVTGLPAGVSASFSPSSIPGTGSSTMTLTASSSAPLGTYPLTIKGTSGALVRTAQMNLLVPAPDYTLKLAPTSSTIVQSEKGTSVISLNNLFGFASTVALTVTGAPAGVTAALSSRSISGTKTSTLTLTTLMTTAPGTYELTITGTSGATVRTALYTLTVAQAIPSFTLTSATTSSSVRYGRSTTLSYKLTMAQKYGFRGTITMSAAGMPPGTNGTFTVPTVNITSTSAFYTYYSLPIPAGTPVGKYTVTFTGVGYEGTAKSASATITVS